MYILNEFQEMWCSKSDFLEWENVLYIKQPEQDTLKQHVQLNRF